jgi:ubiquitin-protein ligase
VTAERSERLRSDYRDMLKIQNRPYLSWIVTKGEPPYAEEYLLHIKLRSYVFRMQGGECAVGAIHSCTVSVSLRPSYPYVAPYIRMSDIPPVFHPAWFSKGTYCPPVKWRPDTPLKDYIKDMLGTLCYDPALTETSSPANYKALDWYHKNRENAALFPCDATALTENTGEQAAALEEAAATLGEIVDRWHVG